MGADKALLRFGEHCLLELAVRKASSVAADTWIVGDAESYSAFGRTIGDQFKGCGPLGGIHAALSASDGELNLVFSVDMPLMTSQFLAWLVDRAADGSQLATVPRVNGRSQPLCAVYRRAALSVVEGALKAEAYKVDRIFGAVPTRYIEEEEILAAGFAVSLFDNVNTPAEYQGARQLALGRLAAGSKG
jgi:molybdopterin-guanine dinucleotide biosynthesis protein A